MSLVQVLRHPVVAHWKPPQSCPVAIVQAPLPSQVVVGVKVLPSLLQDAALQVWLAPTLRQAPLPSQVPSLPHWLVAVSSVHALWAI